MLHSLATGLCAGEIVALTGVTAAQAEATIHENPPSRTVLAIDLSGSPSADRAIEIALDRLADFAGRLWPDWAESQDRRPGVSASWRRAATQMVVAGRRPRFPTLARDAECDCLRAALPEIFFLTRVETRQNGMAGETISALEWLTRRGFPVIATLAERPPAEPPWDRLLSDAIDVSAGAFNPGTPPREITSPAMEALRGSRLERRLRGALAVDPHLNGLFEPEIVLDLGPMLAAPRVDMVWRNGKVVVELDGREHEREPTYAADRHRDYELMIAGYLVLRLTNDEVELDLGRSLEKVRRVVNLRRLPA